MRYELDVVRGRDAPRVLAVDADSLHEAQERLRKDGFTILAQRAGARSWLSRLSASFQTSVSAEGAAAGRPVDLTVLLEQLRDLLNAGLSLIEAMSTLSQTSRSQDRDRLDRVISKLKDGHRLSDALATEPGLSALLVDLVRASEQTSDLPGALTRYLEHERKVSELRHRITSIAIYPALLTVVGGGVLLFLLFYVMPRFARVFEGMAGQLPWSAQAMVVWSRFLTANAGWMVAAAAAVIVGAVLAATYPDLRRKAMQGLLGWGPLRDQLRVYFLARWYRTTGMLCSGGIALPQALALANGVLPDALRLGGISTLDAIRSGMGPAEAYQRADMATPVATQLMRAGERTGELGDVLERIASFHDVALERTLERHMRVLEPIVMVLIGLGVGIIVVLMYMPIFELAASIQ